MVLLTSLYLVSQVMFNLFRKSEIVVLIIYSATVKIRLCNTSKGSYKILSCVWRRYPRQAPGEILTFTVRLLRHVEHSSWCLGPDLT